MIGLFFFFGLHPPTVVHAGAVEIQGALDQNKLLIRTDSYDGTITQSFPATPMVGYDFDQLASRPNPPFKMGALVAKMYKYQGISIQPGYAIRADYPGAVYYNGRLTDAHVQWYNFHTNGQPADFIVSSCLYNGWVYRNITQFNVDIWFEDNVTKQRINLESGSFLTVNSLNGVDTSSVYETLGRNGHQGSNRLGEFAGGLSGQQEYVIHGHNLAAINVDGHYVLEGTPDSRFDDVLGGSTFWKNSVMFSANGSTQSFLMGAGYASAWMTFSSALITPAKPPAPVKDVLVNGQSRNGGTVKKGQAVAYKITQKLPTLDNSIRVDFRALTIIDELPQGFHFLGVRMDDEADGSWSMNGNTLSFGVNIGGLFRKQRKEFTYYIDGYFEENNVTYLNQAYNIYEGEIKHSNEVTIATTDEVDPRAIEHYDVETNKLIASDDVPFESHQESHWESYEKTNPETGAPYDPPQYNWTVWYSTYYSYHVEPRKDLWKKTDHGNFKYISYDDKTYSDDYVLPGERGGVKIRMPYIVPRIFAKPTKLIIDTADKSKGLPFELSIDKGIQLAKKANEDFKNVELKIAIIDTNSNEELWSISDKYYNLSSTYKDRLHVPSNYRDGDKIPVKVVISVAANPDYREVILNRAAFVSHGYTASHTVLSSNLSQSTATENAYAQMAVRLPIRTEKVGDDSVKEYFETASVSAKSLHRIKTGYGISTNLSFSYSNDLGHSFDTSIEALVPTSFVRKNTDIHYDMLFDNQSVIPLTSDYGFPHVAVRQGDGLVRKWNDIAGHESEFIDGGNKLYIPFWQDLDKYTITYEFANNGTVGDNKIGLDLDTFVDVYAYMYATAKSDTMKKDELMVKPIVGN